LRSSEAKFDWNFSPLFLFAIRACLGEQGLPLGPQSFDDGAETYVSAIILIHNVSYFWIVVNSAHESARRNTMSVVTTMRLS
jgi:hypothetical protein